MFENCATLTELNKARAEAIQQGASAVQVNKEYTARRTAIQSHTEISFKKINFVKISMPELEVLCPFDNVEIIDDNTLGVSNG